MLHAACSLQTHHAGCCPQHAALTYSPHPIQNGSGSAGGARSRTGTRSPLHPLARAPAPHLPARRDLATPDSDTHPFERAATLLRATAIPTPGWSVPGPVSLIHHAKTSKSRRTNPQPAPDSARQSLTSRSQRRPHQTKPNQTRSGQAPLSHHKPPQAGPSPLEPRHARAAKQTPAPARPAPTNSQAGITQPTTPNGHMPPQANTCDRMPAQAIPAKQTRAKPGRSRTEGRSRGGKECRRESRSESTPESPEQRERAPTSTRQSLRFGSHSRPVRAKQA
jgi:hypothetical protein